jgi:molybdopterin-binding protein
VRKTDEAQCTQSERNPAVISASITNEALEELRLRVGEEAYAVIKASDVMVGKDD